MGKICLLIMLVFAVFACKKDEQEPKTGPTSCQNLNMTGDLDRVTGHWKWIYTEIEQVSSFTCQNIGTSYVFPADVNFTFKLEIADNGKLSVMKNDTLIDVLNFTGINYSTVHNDNSFAVGLYYNCSEKGIDIVNFSSHDTMYVFLPHLRFNGVDQAKTATLHMFVRN